MRRREFVRTMGGGALGLTALGGCGRGDESAPQAGIELPDHWSALPAFSVWAWVHGSSERDLNGWREHFGPLRAAGVDAVLVGGGEVGLVSEAARAEGLAYHRWFWTLNRNGDRWVQENRPEWFTVSRNGDSSLEMPPYVGYYKWVCPSRAPVREYLAQRVAEIAATPGVEGVHLDYVRHCDVILPRGLWESYDLVQDVEHPEFDFCYCDECRAQFAEFDGRDPLEMLDPPSDEAWRRFRWDSVTGAVKKLTESVHDEGKPITAAVFPTPTIARRLVRQAWEEWPLDRFFPMLYHRFYLEDLAWIGAGVREGVAALDGRPLNAGLYLPDLSPSELAQAVAICRETGASGVSLFESNGLSAEHLAALGGA